MGGASQPLPRRQLGILRRHLPCILDNAMLSGRKYPPRRLPWLLMPSAAAVSFFCVACKDT
ncbi:hypothetical protein E2562_021555 [Oryza meyeriana var. granulata]|uniref:Uncharacterized protein n=1 Tax=Oryza meyeriana var. granulata TaxID=110450 RepID=A0A6G1EXU9_9ORYZ|nr:hypothetical protein E2562_021555 [Oryza meyeriana var. granulata]